jgi:argininosuccinate lyase
MPGMTHMQHAQPILFSHFLLAHAEAFFRDIVRLDAAEAMADACPMGSGALAGCALDVDRGAIARELGFARPTANSLDAASDRDFALDYLYALAVIATHLSRLAEDFVLFASQEFGFIVLPDEFSTGSSLMPQKKNPDEWELLRGKTGRVTASLHALTTLKGLPSSYQRDLQDKEPCSPRTIRPSPCDPSPRAPSPPRVPMKRACAKRPRSRAARHGSRALSGAPWGAVPTGARKLSGRLFAKPSAPENRSLFAADGDAAKEFSPLFGPDFYDALKPRIRAGRSRRGKAAPAPARVRDAIAARKSVAGWRKNHEGAARLE